MNEKVKLDDIVAEMVASDIRCSRVLGRGLVLGFTPQDGRGVKEGARFVWSRVNEHPSEVEDKIMRKSIEKGMRAVERLVVVGGPTFRTSLVIRKGWGSSMMYWKWVESSVVLMLKGKERERAMEWIKLV